VDLDGVTRRAWLLAAYDGQVYAALSLVMAQALLGNPALQLRFADHAPWQSGSGPLEAIELRRHARRYASPVAEQASVLLPFRGGQGSFRYHSAADVLAGRLPADSLRGRVVLLGTTAPGLLDQRVTPVGRGLSGGRGACQPARRIARWSPAAIAGLHGDARGRLAGHFVASVCCSALPRLSPAGAVVLAVWMLVLLTIINLAAWTVGMQLVLPMAASLLSWWRCCLACTCSSAILSNVVPSGAWRSFLASTFRPNWSMR
jgi:adenylate cyclase